MGGAYFCPFGQGVAANAMPNINMLGAGGRAMAVTRGGRKMLEAKCCIFVSAESMLTID